MMQTSFANLDPKLTRKREECQVPLEYGFRRFEEGWDCSQGHLDSVLAWRLTILTETCLCKASVPTILPTGLCDPLKAQHAACPFASPKPSRFQKFL